MKNAARCPRCKSMELCLVELWKNHSIEFEQSDQGEVDWTNGNLSEGEPYCVQACCNSCNHKWTLRGVQQVIDLPNYTS